MFGDKHWADPLAWNRAADREGIRKRVFCASMADVFEDHPALGEPRERLWGLIDQTEALDWLLLTKRPENVGGMVPWNSNWPENVWLGTSVEDQRRAEERIPVLVTYPARMLFLSCEPLLGAVDVSPWLLRPYERQQGGYWEYGPDTDLYGNGKTWRPGRGVDWTIGGGESGQKARPARPDWFSSLRDQCAEVSVPYHHKQHGEFALVADRPGFRDVWVAPDGTVTSWEYGDGHSRSGLGPITGGPGYESVLMRRVGLKTAGRELGGVIHDAMPELVR